MRLILPARLLGSIQAQAESAYPEETAGLLLGRHETGQRRAIGVLALENVFEPEERYHRYRLRPEAMLAAEEEAERRGLDIVGVYHSHPDHPAVPSEFDRQWALPWFIYLISTVLAGRANASRAWLLSDDRNTFVEVELRVEAEREGEEV